MSIKGLRSLWRKELVPADGGGLIAFEPAGGRVAVANSMTISGTSFDGRRFGILTVLDARTGDVVFRVEVDKPASKLVYSPDSRWLAWKDDHLRRMRIFDAVTGEVVTNISTSSGMFSDWIEFNHESTWVVGAGLDRTTDGTGFGSGLVSFDATNGQLRWMKFVDSGVDHFSLAPDSVSAAFTDSPHIVVLDTATGEERLRINEPSASRVAYSPDNKLIISGCSSGAVNVFDTTGELVWSIPSAAQVSDEFQPIKHIVVSKNSRWLAAISQLTHGSVLSVYDLDRATTKFPPIRLSSDHIELLALSPTLRHIGVDGSTPQGMCVFDARTGEVISTSDNDNYNGPIFAPDGNVFAASHSAITTLGFRPRSIEMFDLGLEASSREIGQGLSAVAMSPGGIHAVVAEINSFTVILAASGALVIKRPYGGFVTAIGVADSGQAVVVAGTIGVQLFGILDHDHFWKVDGIDVSALAVVGPAGDWIAVAADKTVRLLSAVDGSPRWLENTHPKPIPSGLVAADSQGRWIATGCNDKKIRIFDAATGAGIFTGEAADGRIRAMAFRPGGTLLGIATENGVVSLVDAANPAQAPRQFNRRPVACSRLAFSKDGLVAVADDANTVAIFDVNSASSTAQLVFSLPGEVTALAFDPAETRLAVACESKVTIFDARNGEEIQRVLHQQPLREIGFSADGKQLATTADDGIVRVWAV